MTTARRAPLLMMQLAVTLLAVAGCGATGNAGGGASHLPVSGAGPFTPLEPDPSLDRISPPFVLADTAGNVISSAALLKEHRGLVLVFYRGYW